MVARFMEVVEREETLVAEVGFEAATFGLCVQPEYRSIAARGLSVRPWLQGSDLQHRIGVVLLSDGAR
jgi:hypothetical protein